MDVSPDYNPPQMPTIDEQLQLLGRRAERILGEQDLRAKLGRGKPLRIKMGMDPTAPDVTLGHAAHVAVVDVPSRKVQGYILVGKRSWGLGMTRNEKILYVANGFGDDITVIDLQTRRATISIPVGRIPWGVVIDD